MNQNQQSGRSMIEMLGVLAIIGVLSVGGLYGLRTAQNKYKANAIISDVMLGEADILPRLENITPPTGSETVAINFSFRPKVSGAAAYRCENGAEIVFSNVAKAVCERIMQMDKIKGITDWGVTTNNTACMGTLSTTCGDSNILVFSAGTDIKRCGDGWCNSNQFCLYSGNADDSSDPGSSSCADISSNPPIAITTEVASVSQSVQHWVASSSGMNWWSAKSWCEAQGLHLTTKENVVVGCDMGWKSSGDLSCTTGGKVLTTTGESWDETSHMYALSQKAPFYSTSNWAHLGEEVSKRYAFVAHFVRATVFHMYYSKNYRPIQGYALCQ